MGVPFNKKKVDNKKDDDVKHIDNEHTIVKILNPLFEEDEELKEEEIKIQ